MYGLAIFLFILICISLIMVILLQSSKGGGLAGAFGGGGDMGAVFGGRGAATFLSRVTTGLAVAFLAFSLLLSFINRGSSESTSLVQEAQQQGGSVPASGLPIVPIDDSQQPLPVESDQQASASSDSGQ